MKKTGSFLSMENLDLEDDEEEITEEEVTKSEKSDNPLVTFKSENVILHPVYILE
jgi:hypothetical protein